MPDKARNWRRVANKNLTRGDRVCGFIESCCHVPEGARVGQLMQLDPFQKRFIYEVYDNPNTTNRAILSMARKNGKSSLIAALALCYITGPLAVRNSQIVSGAMSRDQAAIIFSLAAKMVRLSPKLSPIVQIVPSTKRLVGLLQNVEFHAISAEAKTAMGLSPLVAILDETGQVQGPVSPFVEAIITSQGAHENPLLVVISTQAPTDADLLSLWIDDALTGADPHTVCHLYTAPKDCALDDPKAWAAANPGLGTIRVKKDLEQQVAQAVRMPSAEPGVRNLLLNQRIQRLAPFLSPNVWASGDEAIDEDLFGPGGVVYAGLDLSASTDLSVLCLAAEDNAGIVHLKPLIWTPEATLHPRSLRDRAPYPTWADKGQLIPVPGRTIDYDFIATAVGELTGQTNLAAICYDRWRIDVFRQSLNRLGVTVEMKPFGQGFKDMSPAVDIFEKLAVDGRLRHGGHPVLRWAISNAVLERDAAGNRKLTKSKSFGRIDPAVAALMAVAAMKLQTEEILAEPKHWVF